MTNLWTFDNPVNKVSVLKKLPGLFVNIKSIQLGFWTYLKHVGSLFILYSSCWNKKLSRPVSPSLILKYLTDINFL